MRRETLSLAVPMTNGATGAEANVEDLLDKGVTVVANGATFSIQIQYQVAPSAAWTTAATVNAAGVTAIPSYASRMRLVAALDTTGGTPSFTVVGFNARTY